MVDNVITQSVRTEQISYGLGKAGMSVESAAGVIRSSPTSTTEDHSMDLDLSPGLALAFSAQDKTILPPALSQSKLQASPPRFLV